MKISEGTKSYLFGCHQSLIHPLWVLLAWRLEYKSWPKWWEIVCIFLHDVGINGWIFVMGKFVSCQMSTEIKRILSPFVVTVFLKTHQTANISIMAIAAVPPLVK